MTVGIVDCLDLASFNVWIDIHLICLFNKSKGDIMERKNFKLIKAMEKALNFEEKGFHIYSDVAQTSFNPVVIKTFTFLAEQEENHIKEIKHYIEKENPEMKLLGEGLSGIKEFFNMSVDEYKEGIEFSKSDISAYEKALFLEQSSYDYYKSQLQSANDNHEKKFFSFLMEQESAHYLLIENTLRFLKDPSQFFAEEENWIFEG
jgi:rubrerythrin